MHQKQVHSCLVRTQSEGISTWTTVPTSNTRRKEHHEQKAQLTSIMTANTLKENKLWRIQITMNKQTSNWLTTLYTTENGFNLNKQEFRDAVALRYNAFLQPVHVGTASMLIMQWSATRGDLGVCTVRQTFSAFLTIFLLQRTHCH